MTSPATSSWTQKLKSSRKFLAGGALALGLVLVFVLFFSPSNLYQIYRFRQERVALERENSRLAAENDRLARTIDRLQHDPEMIQDLIRRELNFIKKNEIIFQLPPAVGGKPPEPTPTPKAEAKVTPPQKPPAPREGGGKTGPWGKLEGAPPQAAAPGGATAPRGN